MRIISGRHKGKIIKVPRGLDLRPTTDFAKEALFNILANKIGIVDADENRSILDLFCGTGHISMEFASREWGEITAVDKNIRCLRFIEEMNKELAFKIDTIKTDVFDFIKKTKIKYDLIFADPPYDLDNIDEIHSLIFEYRLLNPGGLLIIEHGKETNFEKCKFFTEHRKYGNVNFSFFVFGQ